MKKRIVIITLFISMVFSCATYNLKDYRDIDTIRVAAVGDSITYGAFIKNRAEESYPAQLQAMLGDGWSVLNFGVNGATLLRKGDSSYWKKRQLIDAYEFQPDLVIIKLGTNDSKQQNWQYKDQFVSDYVELINSFQVLESRPLVYICYPIQAYSDRWRISEKVIKGELPDFIDQISLVTGVEIIDLYTPLSNKPELFPDTIHPNADGASIIAETIFSKIKELPDYPKVR
ncbi:MULTISPECIES: GDSL-type esterase/lipase family protein [unclassified Oceanispirochaeta]|uniref:GDSL-type esterase/lipase family protein n=1 Tax=unclassified Oceanispirochaeta TaxID=2635722 RepID=UPI000E0969CF|nr:MULTISPECIES: GDSL-type esterase/lipase family protein [unclassified Oceanispirochaeta]MBF9015993.1 hypothetical protein [Oceanispirochaeta sp. M2]NPD72456.1 hypothetical protein [Oceanispirochaeta sp. M1]RDG31915.1 hypothetical protein DV872_10120 [Oceanispirochaeta sp. M1]